MREAAPQGLRRPLLLHLPTHILYVPTNSTRFPLNFVQLHIFWSLGSGEADHAPEENAHQNQSQQREQNRLYHRLVFEFSVDKIRQSPILRVSPFGPGMVFA